MHTRKMVEKSHPENGRKSTPGKQKNGKCMTWKMHDMENAQHGKCTTWKMHNMKKVENAHTGK